MAGQDTKVLTVQGGAPVSRRTMIGATALVVPAVALAVSTPAFAASGARSMRMEVVPDPHRSSGSSQAATVAQYRSTSAAQVSQATVADSVSSAQPGYDWKVRVKVIDADNFSGLLGQVVQLTGPSEVSFAQSGGVTDAFGMFETVATVTAGPATSPLVVATSPSASGTVTISKALVPDPASVDVVLSTNNAEAGQTEVVVTARVLSVFGAPVGAGVAVALSSSGPLSTSIAGVTNDSGEFVTTFTAPYDEGVSTITAKCGEFTASASFATYFGPLTLQLSSTSILPGQSVDVTVRTPSDGSYRNDQLISITGTNGMTFATTDGRERTNGFMVYGRWTTTAFPGAVHGSQTITVTMTVGGTKIVRSRTIEMIANGTSLAAYPSHFYVEGVGAATFNTMVTATVTENGAPVANRRIYFESRQSQGLKSSWPEGKRRSIWRATSAVTDDKGVASVPDTLTAEAVSSVRAQTITYYVSSSANFNVATDPSPLTVRCDRSS